MKKIIVIIKRIMVADPFFFDQYLIRLVLLSSFKKTEGPFESINKLIQIIAYYCACKMEAPECFNTCSKYVN